MAERKRPYHRTQIAKFGADIAVVFAAKFYQTQINGYQPVLREPTGVSTGGGRQPLQHLILNPPSGSGSVITIGSVNVVDRSAKVRSYDCLMQMNAKRFESKAVPLQSGAYTDLLQRIIQFLHKQGLEVEVVEAPPRLPPSVRATLGRKKTNSTPWWSLLGLLVLALGGVALAVWLLTH